MKALAFRNWVKSMIATNRARSEQHCAEILGVSRNTFEAYKTRGGKPMLGYACAWLAKHSPRDQTPYFVKDR